LHANALGVLSGAWPVIVPPGPGVLCEYGDATTQIQDEASQTYVARVDELTTEGFVEQLETLRARASESFEADGISSDQQEVSYQADIRYAGQAFQLSLSVTTDEVESQGLAVLTNEFDRQHEQLFTFAHGKDHEIVMIRAIVKAKSSLTADLKEVGDKKTKLEDAKFHDTKFYYEQEWHDAVI
jgi:N-methylhydantoinase A